ncbi:hypothetical protein VPNG_02138 [Cytospora leucostoma]|uniref:Uncharacterized protein n=1 Tax=Cytospora leucostoma TaxID=1230097 RepID=A0A423XH62_9PEZI|nr:hypothetical protein VPNG_02138 [Cytospora leucostoma]
MLAPILSPMWFVILLATPILAIILATLLPRTEPTEWVEFNNTDARPEAEAEPMPEYDDPYLRPDHPFWEGHPPLEVIAGGYTWDPPSLRQITPPVPRTPRRKEEKPKISRPDLES